VELPLIVVIDITYSGLVAIGNVIANFVIFASIFLLNFS